MAIMKIEGKELYVNVTLAPKLTEYKVKLPRKRKKAFIQWAGREAYHERVRMGKRFLSAGWPRTFAATFPRPIYMGFYGKNNW